jgi:predicted transcriptional regulator
LFEVAEKHQFMERLRYTFDEFLSIIKIFILSQNEINYIKEIEAEILKGEELDKKINELTTSINHENEKKREKKSKVDMAKSKGMSTVGDKNDKTGVERESPEKLLQNISILENKLEKAHQKLNTTVSQNAQYREKINILRKEKNVMNSLIR